MGQDQSTREHPDTTATDITGEVRRSAGQVADEAKRAGEAVRSEAADLVDSVRDETMRHAETGREKAAERLSSLADTIRDSTGELRRHEAWLADLVDKGAQELEGLAAALQRRDLNSLLGSVQDFARRQPALYAGAAVALGFAAARLAKSTGERGSANGGSGVQPSHPASRPGSYALHEAPAMGGGFAPSAAEATPSRGEPL